MTSTVYKIILNLSLKINLLELYLQNGFNVKVVFREQKSVRVFEKGWKKSVIFFELCKYGNVDIKGNLLHFRAFKKSVMKV